MTFAEYKIFAVITAVHWAPLLLAAWLWPLRKINLSVSSAITLLFTIVAWLIVGICLLIFSDVSANGRAMTGFAAYLIYSLMTLGVVPALVVAVHVFAGRSAGLWIRYGVRKLAT